MAALKVIEVVGISVDGWEAAARAAVAEAARTVRQLETLELVRCTAELREGTIVEYHALVRLAFRVEHGSELLEAVEAAETMLAEPSSASTVAVIGLPLVVDMPEEPAGLS